MMKKIGVRAPSREQFNQRDTNREQKRVSEAAAFEINTE